MSDIIRPHDHEAERWTIGGLLIDPSVAPEVFATVQPDDFDDELACSAAHSIHRSWQTGEPIDVKFVLRDMKNTGGDVGDYAGIYLGEVAATIPTAAHAKHYAQQVAEAARKRRCLDLGMRLTHDAQNGKASANILEDLLQDASGLVDHHGGKGDPWATWEKSLDDLDRRVYFDIAPPNNQLSRLGFGPGMVTAIGAKPGIGKTALVNQCVIHAMMEDIDLVALIANCETDPGTLLDRHVARIGQISYSVIRDRSYRGDTADKVRNAAALLLAIRPRLHFMGPPFTMSRVRALAASTKADIVVVDYLQRFKPSTDASDQRQQVSDVITDCRDIAMSGPAVVAISAMSRGGDFRESSEIEYGCDNGFVIEEVEGEPETADKALLARCIKNRHGSMEDIDLTFCGRFQEMTAPPEVQPWDIG